jgi:hypothetical protein
MDDEELINDALDYYYENDGNLSSHLEEILLNSIDEYNGEDGFNFNDGDFIDEYITAYKLKIKPNGKIKFYNKYHQKPHIIREHSIKLDTNNLREFLKSCLRIDYYKLKDGTIINKDYVDDFITSIKEDFLDKD